MFTRKDILLKASLLLLVTGCLIHFHPFHAEPVWMEWLVGPILIFLGLPMAMVGMAVHFFGSREESATPLPGAKARG